MKSYKKTNESTDQKEKKQNKKKKQKTDFIHYDLSNTDLLMLINKSQATHVIVARQPKISSNECTHFSFE